MSATSALQLALSRDPYANAIYFRSTRVLGMNTPPVKIPIIVQITREEESELGVR